VPEDAQGCRLPPAETPQARAARGETFSLEFTLPAVDGSRRWYEANGQRLHNGRTGHAVVVIGGFVSLAATGRALDLSALIGLVMLPDIVVTNAIVLLDLAVAINATVLLDLVLHEVSDDQGSGGHRGHLSRRAALGAGVAAVAATAAPAAALAADRYAAHPGHATIWAEWLALRNGDLGRVPCRSQDRWGSSRFAPLGGVWSH
jgi:hypothetical protein